MFRFVTNRLLFQTVPALLVIITATFDQVQGLQAGSLVSFMGIPIGNVKAINFDRLLISTCS